MRYKSYKMRVERNEIQRERRLSKDLNEQKKKNGKNDPGSKKTYKKKTENKNPEGLTVSQLRLHVREDRGREREAQEESLFSGQVRKASATPTPETGYDAAYGPPLPLLLLLPLATSRENGASAQGN